MSGGACGQLISERAATLYLGVTYEATGRVSLTRLKRGWDEAGRL